MLMATLLSKRWKSLIRVGIVLGLISDLFNLLGLAGLYMQRPPREPKVFEDRDVTSLPVCAFVETYEEEAEPAFYLNFLEWLLGIGMIEESAFAKAEYKIWRAVAAEEPSSGALYNFAWGSSFLEMATIERRLEQEKGLKPIHKKFYFDESGYHVRLLMGRARAGSPPPELNSGCEVDEDHGRRVPHNNTQFFTCETLMGVIESNIRRIKSVNSQHQCWTRFLYRIDYQANVVVFDEEYFVREEEVHNGF